MIFKAHHVAIAKHRDPLDCLLCLPNVFPICKSGVPLLSTPPVQGDRTGAPLLHKGEDLVSYVLVGVDARPHLDGERARQKLRHRPYNGFHGSPSAHKSRAHAFLEDQVDWTAHVDVNKVAVHSLLKQLTQACHLRWTTTSNLDPKEVLTGVFLHESPLWSVTLEKRQREGHLSTSNIHAKSLAHPSEGKVAHSGKRRQIGFAFPIKLLSLCWPQCYQICVIGRANILTPILFRSFVGQLFLNGFIFSIVNAFISCQIV